MHELQLLRMFAKVVVTDSDALLISSVRMDPIAPGDVDEVDSSCLLSPSADSLLSTSFVVLSSFPDTNHSISRLVNTALNSLVRNLWAILSCALLSMVVRKKLANPPPITTNARALDALPVEFVIAEQVSPAVHDRVLLFSSNNLPSNLGSAV